MDRDKLKRELLKVIKLGLDRGIRITELENSFQHENGHPLEYDRNKYRSLEELLTDFPDICEIRTYGPITVVFPLLTEEEKRAQEEYLKRDQVRRRNYVSPFSKYNRVTLVNKSTRKSSESSESNPDDLISEYTNRFKENTSREKVEEFLNKSTTDFDDNDNLHSKASFADRIKNKDDSFKDSSDVKTRADFDDNDNLPLRTSFADRIKNKGDSSKDLFGAKSRSYDLPDETSQRDLGKTEDDQNKFGYTPRRDYQRSEDAYQKDSNNSAPRRDYQKSENLRQTRSIDRPSEAISNVEDHVIKELSASRAEANIDFQKPGNYPKRNYQEMFRCYDETIEKYKANEKAQKEAIRLKETQKLADEFESILEFKSEIDYKAKLKEHCDKYRLPPIIYAFSDHEVDGKKVGYYGKVSMGTKLNYTSYPEFGETIEKAENIVAKIAFEILTKEYDLSFKIKKLFKDTNEMKHCHLVEKEYLDFYKEKLPENWLSMIQYTGMFDISVTKTLKQEVIIVSLLKHPLYKIYPDKKPSYFGDRFIHYSER